MSFSDCLLITFFNTAICITLPKMISVLSNLMHNQANKLNDSSEGRSYSEMVSQ